jgi:nucleoside-diphosphate-sugar epimerase
MTSNTIEKGSRVLITGVTGFIATHVGTARSQAKADTLQPLIAKYGSENFKVIITEGLEKEGAFDEAVKGKA